jgi:F-type H+-transporting ATPase subunit delta
LVTKGREGDLFEITNSFIAQYNEIKGIHIVKLTTAVAISDDLKQSIQLKVNTSVSSGTVELETKVDEKLIGGFVLEFDNKLVDASILRDLNDIKKQFLTNYYVPSLI